MAALPFELRLLFALFGLELPLLPFELPVLFARDGRLLAELVRALVF